MQLGACGQEGLSAQVPRPVVASGFGQSHSLGDMAWPVRTVLEVAEWGGHILGPPGLNGSGPGSVYTSVGQYPSPQQVLRGACQRPGLVYSRPPRFSVSVLRCALGSTLMPRLILGAASAQREGSRALRAGRADPTGTDTGRVRTHPMGAPSRDLPASLSPSRVARSSWPPHFSGD